MEGGEGGPGVGPRGEGLGGPVELVESVAEQGQRADAVLRRQPAAAQPGSEAGRGGGGRPLLDLAERDRIGRHGIAGVEREGARRQLGHRGRVALPCRHIRRPRPCQRKSGVERGGAQIGGARRGHLAAGVEREAALEPRHGEGRIERARPVEHRQRGAHPAFLAQRAAGGGDDRRVVGRERHRGGERGMGGGEVERLLGAPRDEVEQQGVALSRRQRRVGQHQRSGHVVPVERRLDPSACRLVEHRDPV